jgi:hypothetical protein
MRCNAEKLKKDFHFYPHANLYTSASHFHYLGKKHPIKLFYKTDLYQNCVILQYNFIFSKQCNHLIIGFVWPEPNSSAAGGRMMQLISLFQEQGFPCMQFTRVELDL